MTTTDLLLLLVLGIILVSLTVSGMVLCVTWLLDRKYERKHRDYLEKRRAQKRLARETDKKFHDILKHELGIVHLLEDMEFIMSFKEKEADGHGAWRQEDSGDEEDTGTRRD